jgi:hypothetical protein
MVNLGAERLTLLFVYSGEFAERVIRNLINDPSFCKSCGLCCDSCKYNAYSHVQNIRAAIKLPEPSALPAFIDNPKKYMPKKIPKADVCISSETHKDLLLELPPLLQSAGVKALVVPIEDFAKVPTGLRRQVEEKCLEAGLEYAFPKPFCSLEPSQDKPVVSRFVNEMRVGRPWLEIMMVKHGKSEVVESAMVRHSAPCGSTWYIAKKLLGVDTRKDLLYDATAKAHHSYPCTATMEIDPEAKEPILHLGGYTIREEVEKAISRQRSYAS